MSLPEGASAVPRAAPAKRSLFKKPAWAPAPVVQAQNTSSDAVDFFCRSDSSWKDFVGPRDGKRKRGKALTENNDPTIRRSANERDSEGEETSNGSEEASSSDEKSRPESKKISTSRSTSPAVTIKASPRALSKRYVDTVKENRNIPVIQEPKQMPKSSIPATNVISLESDEESDESPVVHASREPRAPAHVPSTYDDPELSEEEFPELARKAREKARQLALQADAPKLQESTKSALPHDPTATSKAKPWSQLPEETEPVISLLITSPIEDSRPLVVKRKLSQPLKEPRVYWCHKQDHGPELTDNVVLVWRGIRLFDSTSCKSLGIRVDQYGNLVRNGVKDVFGEDKGQIHLEAMTLEMLAERIKSKSEKAKASLSTYASYDRNAEVDEVDEVDELVKKLPAEKQTKIILKAKDLPELKIVVKESTLVSKIITAFRSDNKDRILPDSDVQLYFDGERLSPDSKVCETDLSDMDNVEVYIR
ncbi:hypothetical protein MMC25_004796 [Agyrium rufum]|nr:hypothetical protein [Agyrium rufum]